MAHLAVTIHPNSIDVCGQGFCWRFPDVGKNRKVIWAILRGFYVPETGKSLFTYQEIAEAFRYKARQNIENFVAEFEANGGDILQYISRKNTKHERFCEPIADQILTSPGLGIHQQYVAFREEHPDEPMSETSFRKYARDLDVLTLLKRVHSLFSEQREQFDATRYLQEILEMERIPAAKKKEIVALFPETQAASFPCQASLTETFSGFHMERKLLVVLLYVCNVSQEMLSLLFGVSKTSIHRYIYAVCCEDVTWHILGHIARWSGQVSFDEKWIKIDGTWHFVLCAVDAVSGFPLLMEVYPTLDTVSWTVFFRRFRTLYGVPRLIQCDGAQALAAGNRGPGQAARPNRHPGRQG